MVPTKIGLFEIQVYLLIWKFSMLLDPDSDLHSHYGSGSRTAKSVWIRIHSTAGKGGF
jgi:hypothetical protein